MRILIDTNIVVPLENSTHVLEESLSKLVYLANEGSVYLSLLVALFLVCTPSIGLAESLDELAVKLKSKSALVKSAAFKKLEREYFPEDPEKGKLWSRKESLTIDRILVGLLADPDPQIRLKAIGFSLESTSTVPINEVAKLLQDQNDQIRAAAARIYIFVEASDDVLRKLEMLLGEKNDVVRSAAVYSLGPNCKRTAPAVIQAAYQNEQDKDLKQSLAETLKCAVPKQKSE